MVLLSGELLTLRADLKMNKYQVKSQADREVMTFNITPYINLLSCKYTMYYDVFAIEVTEHSI